MSLDMFKVCLDKLPKSVGIRFTGFSEPFLNPACSDMILYAQERGHTIRVSTTLVGMTPRDVEAIESVPFELFNVHFPSEDSSEEVIPVDDAYLETVKSLDESEIRVSYHCLGEHVHPKLAEGRHVRFIIPHDRAGNVDEDEARKLRIRRLKKTVRQFQDKNPASLKVYESQSESKVNLSLRTLSDEDEVQASGEGQKSVKPFKMGSIRCVKELRENVLLPNGNVVACCNDYGLEHVFGNLLEQDYESLFRSDEYKRLEALQKDDSRDLLCRRDCEYARGSNLMSRMLVENKYVYALRHTRGIGDVVLLAKRALRDVAK